MQLQPSKYRVREYDRSECEYIASIAGEMVSSGVLAPLVYSSRKVESWLLSAHANPKVYFQRIIVDENDVPVGLFVFHRAIPFYAENAVALDTVIFVQKKHRGRCIRRVQDVLMQFVAWSRARGDKLHLIGSSSGIDPDTTERVFEFLGFKKIGTVHAYMGD